MISYWSVLLALSILIYVVLDGFDLGVGMLFGIERNVERRQDMLASVAPLWDGNETWLVVAGVVLWGAFPRAYALLVPAFYVPVAAMLAGLIFRGVAFEFRARAARSRGIWDAGFVLGSLIAAFMQGAMVGSLVEGLPIVAGRFTGNDMSWFSPFSLMSGGTLCVGYALLGAGWIAKKCEGGARDVAWRTIPMLLAGVLVLLILLFEHALHASLTVMLRWTQRPVLFAVPAVALCAVAAVWQGVRHRRDTQPFVAIVVLFACAFVMLAISFWPYVIPFSLTITEAAAPPTSLAFMFWGAGLVVYPLMLVYTACSYAVFGGKVERTTEHY